MGRIYVRGIESGEYGLAAERERLKNAPRVIKGKDIPWRAVSEHQVKQMITPETSPCQSIQIHVDIYPQGACSEKHGHMNEALFYILEGKGYDIHDGKRYDWEAGDVAIVHNASVHQHFNADPEKRAMVVVIKSKPLFNFLNLIQQETVNSDHKEEAVSRRKD